MEPFSIRRMDSTNSCIFITNKTLRIEHFILNVRYSNTGTLSNKYSAIYSNNDILLFCIDTEVPFDNNLAGVSLFRVGNSAWNLVDSRYLHSLCCVDVEGESSQRQAQQ